MARVLVPVAEGCEELEVVTIVDLLRRAGIDVVMAGLLDGPVNASRGVVLLPDMTLQEALTGSFDMVVLPGGLPGADHLDNDPRIHLLLQQMAEAGKVTAAICAAPKVLANAGILEGRDATSYPGVIDTMGLPATRILSDAVVEDGLVITSRGPGTAMAFALTLIKRLVGIEKRNEVAASLLWQE